MSDEDPGWPPVKSLAWLLVPKIGVERVTQKGRGGALLQIRLTFISFVSAVCLFQVVLAFLLSESQQPVGGPIWLFVVLIVIGGLSAVLLPRFEKPLDCTSDLTLVASYRTRYFTRVAATESSALVAFVGAITTREWWIYPLGLLVSLRGFARFAPTSRHLARDQAFLSDQGCRRLLVKALASPPPQPPASASGRVA